MAARSAAATRLTTKGQVVIPKALRTALGWRSGTRLRVEAHGDMVMLRPSGKSSVQGWLSEISGCVEHGDPVGELEAEHREEVARDARRRP